MPSPVELSGCRKIFSLDMESSEVDDGKNDAIQDPEKSSSPTFAAHEGLMNYTSDPKDFAVIINKIFSNPDELINEYSLNASKDSSKFNTKIFKVVNDSELNKLGSSTNYSPGGKGDMHYDLCQDQTISGQPERVRFDDTAINASPPSTKKSQKSHNATVNSSSSPKFQNHYGSAFSTFEEIATDAIVESDSGRVEHTQLGRIKRTSKEANLHFHPFKKLNVQKEQKPQSSQPIDVTEEAPKKIDAFLFGAEFVEQDFDWTYMRNFKQMYEEDRWENYSYKIGQDEPNHDASTPALPSLN